MHDLHKNDTPMTVAKLKAGLQTRIIGNEILIFDDISSTMDEARKNIRDSRPEGLAIFSEHQSTGKGRRGSIWDCRKYGGLLTTIILKPGISPDSMSYLMGISSIAIAETIRHLLYIQPEVKWPNDITIGHRKVAGVLIEVHGQCSRTFTFAVGIGINVNLTTEELPANTKTPATSLALETGSGVDRIKLAQTLLQSLDTWYLYLREGQYEFIRESWRDLCLAFGQELTIREDGKDYCGQFVDITPNGELVLRLRGGAKKRFEGAGYSA